MTDANDKNTALVVGGGLAGMQAALVLAGRGHRVVLADSAPAAGGLFPLLDKQFPTQSCGVCFMACDTPTYCPFIQAELHENIELMPNARVESVRDSGGDFSVTFSIAPTSVDPHKCTDCGACEAVCPVEVEREFGDRLETRKAIYRAYPKSVGKGYVVDRDSCTRCGKCVEACDPGAIELDAPGTSREVQAASVILSPGATLFDARAKGEYGQGRYKNVISAANFERLLAEGGPTGGKMTRPSDCKPPQSLAFIQCVGSRDPANGQGNCSSVCCMFTLKQALFAREKLPNSKITLYYMDLRAFGKGYEEYIDRAKATGIEFVRAIPSLLRHNPATGDLTIATWVNGATREDNHSLVVLATGFKCSDETSRLASLFGLETDSTGALGALEFDPCATSTPGVFTAGVFRSPKDIPESTQEGAAAAALAAARLTREGSPIEPPFSTPADFRDEALKIGVVLCDCEGYTSKFIDLDEIGTLAAKLPGVAFVERVSHACSKPGMNEVRALFGTKEPNRLILASCTHRIVGDLYRHMFKEAGVHPGVFDAVDLRGAARSNDSSVASELIASACEAATVQGFGEVRRTALADNVLVVGGGPAGLSAADTLAKLGHTVHLIEKSAELGGNLKHSHFTIKGGDPAAWLASTIAALKENPLVQIHTRAQAVASSGHLGRFVTRVETPEGSVELIHGATLIATGATERPPVNHGYGQSPRIVTQRTLEKMLADGTFTGGRVVMVQCVGSREKGEGKAPWCSRVCCSHAIKNARFIKNRFPSSAVTVLYRDLRAYGHFEPLYEAARCEGVTFTAFDLSAPPQITPLADKVRVAWQEPSLGATETVDADWLVLSTGMEPNGAETGELAKIFGVEIDSHGFFTEKNPKAATTDFAKPGVYVAGLAHGPKHAEEALTQATAAAGRISAVLSRKSAESLDTISYVSENICSRCGVCVDVCPFGARTLDFELNVAVVDPFACKACGACVTACPNKAARQYGAAPGQVLAALDYLL